MPNKKIKLLFSVIIIIFAILSLYSIWQYYFYSPWTRDARIRAKIITVAPDVSGFVTKVYVKDIQKVKKGDLIFSIDDVRYIADFKEKEAIVDHAKLSLELAQQQYNRRKRLGKSGAISKEELDDYLMTVKLKKAALEKANADFLLTEINLRRTRVYAHTDGTVYNINLRQGNYVTATKPVMSIIEKNSFYVTGYFEETKIPNIKIEEKAEIQLIAGGKPLYGHVIGIDKAVADNNTSLNSQLLPKVQDTYDWVRLLKRIPVDISLEVIPENINLVAGMNASVKIL
ncbi:efflux transporter periplasmic adaptor subunit [Francisella halioticida]|uniref:Efflux transporter periplasmic adaptor subunit n=1 Tax=Francisella halioticida TaxID=549298 RepID=A0ABM6LZS4_9GAMM|nr:HlyD family secretion protein [Francisella halioticida]ASG68059.1 efflux transporter periplasmic adaptor subunit [Francisella halioticida]